MAILDLFFKRQKRARGEMPDVYTYDKIPDPVRVQVVHLLTEILPDNSMRREQRVEPLLRLLRKELGVFKLVEVPFLEGAYHELVAFLLSAPPEKMLSAVEVSFTFFLSEFPGAEAIIEELNGRFREAGVGFLLEGARIIRIDSQFLHAEAVKPALQLLSFKDYRGPNQEFLKAHEHYRSKRHKEAITEACKAFESTLKAICVKRGWAYDKDRDTAKALIKIITDKGLLPDFLDGQVGTLRALLENGIPTSRNRRGGHGQGPIPVDVPEHFARYVLNLTATTIVFLIEAEEAID